MNLPVYCSLFLQVAAAFVIAAVSAKHDLKESKRLSGPLTNLQFHNDLMYIGGRNKIYALDKNLNIISSVNTCDGKEQDCNNINKVLVVDPTGNRLITCGTGKKGICELRPLDNLASVNSSSPPGTVSSDLDKPAVGMINSNEKFVIAVTFGSDIVVESPKQTYQTYSYAISTRDISTLRVEKKLKLEIYDVGLENYIIYYKKCLQHAGFSYFVTNQKVKVEQSNSEYISKFIRICQNDTDYNSYADVVISCDAEYNFIQDAILVNSENGSKIFMGIFTKSQDPYRHFGDSVICGVKLKVLDDAIKDAKKNFFFNDCSDKNNKVRYLPNQSKRTNCNDSAHDFQASDFHCPTAFSLSLRYVTGNKSCEFKRMFRLHADDGTLTSLSSTVLNDESSVILAGTSTGKIIMMNFRNMSLTKYDMMTVDSSTSKPVRAMYQEDDDTLYVMTTDRISKFASSNCSEFKTCHDTMKGMNPLCGWCVFENRATRKSNCTTGNNHWLSSLTECIQLVLDPKGIPVVGDDSSETSGTKQIRIHATNIPDHRTGDEYKCVFIKNGLERIKETAASRSGNSFTCEAPQVSSHTIAVLELVTGNITLAKADFLFYNCTTYMKCGECVETIGSSCVWSSYTCKSPEDEEGAVIKKKSLCPALADARGQHYLSGGEISTIEMAAININSSMNLLCKAGKLGLVSGWAESNVVRCNFSFPEQDVRKKNYTIQVFYENKRAQLDDDFENYVTVYNCSLLGKDCSYCGALNTRYKCRWCDRKCSYSVDPGNCQECPKPNLTSILPIDGPVQGGTKVTIYGTELGSDYRDVSEIKVAAVNCEKSETPEDYGVPESDDFVKNVSKWIVCTTGKTGNGSRTGNVIITVNSEKSDGNVKFSYKEPVVTAIKPESGPKAGGTTITIIGENLGIGTRNNFVVIIGSIKCTNARLNPYFPVTEKKNVSYTILCEIGKSISTEPVKILYLNMNEKPVVVEESIEYRFLTDPTITLIQPKKAILSGGIRITVEGKNLTHAHKARLEGRYGDQVLKSKCDMQSSEKVVCYAPKASTELKNELFSQLDDNESSNRRKRSACKGCVEVQIAVYLDGYEEPFIITYFRDPLISSFGNGGVRLFAADDQELKISGKYLNYVAQESDVNITIGVETCAMLELKENSLTCLAPSNQPKSGDPNFHNPEVNVTIGNVRARVGFLEYEKKIEMLTIIAGSVGGVLFAIIVIAIAFGLYKYRKVRRKAREYEKNLSEMEMDIKRVAREEFLDMHTTMSSVNKNLVEQGFPYHNYQQFACNVMFSVDYLWTEPVMTDDERLKANKGMESLELLISNKFFLVSVITTMENEKRFFIREKSNLAGNLCAVLMGRMDYLNEILKLLMTNLVQESSTKKHKTLFRRCESITEKLLSNWLSLCLYPHVKSHSGSPLYLLYMATQKTMESGPIDAVTGDAKYTLSEEKLLKKWSSSVEEDDNHDLKFEAKTLTLNVVVDNGEEIFKCKALDCDTVSQVKSKCLNQIYVNYPASQLPVGADDLALEWHEGFGGALRLRDEDNTSKREGHWVRLNTLAHYNVKDESNMALIDPHSAEINNQEDYVNLANINMEGVCDGSIDSSQPLTPHDEENSHEFEHWHLVKKEEESAKQGKSAIAELYLNRLFTTKQSLMEYMRPLFDLILDHDRCPPPTKFLYDFLDELGEKYKVETDTVHAWKSHSYAIRVWASLMKMPNTLFDVAIPSFMEENLNIISQVFIESFSLASQKFTKDSPSQKLIFHHEMNHYRDRVKEFYKNVKVDSQNSEEFRQYMAEVNRLQQQTNFNKVSALYRFYNQLKPYFEDILENLSKSKEASTLQLDRKLEQVIAIMEEED